jgi:glycosyltransferase involved in cell wall biosynthesis
MESFPMVKKLFLIILPLLLVFGCVGKRSLPPSMEAKPVDLSKFLATLREKSDKSQVICLNMIVKNEAEVIRRCLDSVKDVIDYWVIMDTGSKDGTQEIIRAHLKDIPGELHERPWKNWGETRTEAFELAKGRGDYILFMDADDILEFEHITKMPVLTEDVYFMWRGTKAFSYIKQQLVKGNLPWKWVGVTHEYLDCAHPYTSGILEGIRYVSLDDGATRHDPKKFWKNVELLQESLKKDPNNARDVFYLAESYRDAGEPAKALEWYQKRIAMAGWAEEVFWAKLQTGHILANLKVAASIVIEAYKDALAYRPTRVEPYYFLAELFNNQHDYKLAYEYIQAWERVEKYQGKDYLFNSDWIKEFGMLFQLSICAYYIGHYEEAVKACDQLTTNKHLPEAWRQLSKFNRQFSVEKLKESTQKTS